MRRGPALLLVVVSIAILQGGLLIAYRTTEDERRGQRPAGRLEEIHDGPRMAGLELERRDGSIEVLPARPGRPTLLHFWATWCPPCREELPSLLGLARRLERSGEMRVVAIATDPGWAEVDSFLAGDVSRHVYRDRDRKAVRAYGVTGLPDTHVIDADGRLRFRLSGPEDWNDPRLLAALRASLRPQVD